MPSTIRSEALECDIGICLRLILHLGGKILLHRKVFPLR